MKAAKLAWVDEQYIISSGFDKSAQREYGVWDSRDLSQPITCAPMGSSTGIGLLYVDEEHKIVYLCGRGES